MELALIFDESPVILHDAIKASLMQLDHILSTKFEEYSQKYPSCQQINGLNPHILFSYIQYVNHVNYTFQKSKESLKEIFFMINVLLCYQTKSEHLDIIDQLTDDDIQFRFSSVLEAYTKYTLSSIHWSISCTEIHTILKSNSKWLAEIINVYETVALNDDEDDHIVAIYNLVIYIIEEVQEYCSSGVSSPISTLNTCTALWILFSQYSNVSPISCYFSPYMLLISQWSSSGGDDTDMSYLFPQTSATISRLPSFQNKRTTSITTISNVQPYEQHSPNNNLVEESRVDSAEVEIDEDLFENVLIEDTSIQNELLPTSDIGAEDDDNDSNTHINNVSVGENANVEGTTAQPICAKVSTDFHDLMTGRAQPTAVAELQTNTFDDGLFAMESGYYSSHQVISIPSCQSGHKMFTTVYHVDYGVYSDGYSCDRCQRHSSQYPMEGGLYKRWSCRSCEYDVCFDCIPLILEDTVSQAAPMCTKKHTMVSGPHAYVFTCGVCNESYSANERRWYCLQCPIEKQICLRCIAELPKICPSNHEMIISASCEREYQCGSQCIYCYVSIRPRGCRWFCFPCRIAVCLTCLPD